MTNPEYHKIARHEYYNVISFYKIHTDCTRNHNEVEFFDFII